MNLPGVGERGRLRLLLDSNVVIAVEPYAGHIEASMELAARLVRLAGEQGHLLCVAPATRDDLLQGKDPQRRAQRLAELEKFHLLEEVPISLALEDAAGGSDSGSNDHRDLRILAALHAGAATYLITNDDRLQRRAARAGLGESVLTIADAVALLVSFAPAEAPPPPRVVKRATYTLNDADPVFDGLRADYPGFDEWLMKVRRESEERTCYVIEEDDGYAGLALLKAEAQCEYPLEQPVVKVSTFKVGERASGLKYGELLLKAILTDAALGGVATLFVEVLETHPEVLAFLESFGFADGGHRNERDEIVMVKSLRPGPDSEDLDDLSFHVRFGPPALRCRQAVYLVPIEPRWHDQLFPELVKAPTSTQLSLFPSDDPATHPWGNALRKAYLCNSPTRTLAAGDVLLFYLSGGSRTVSAVGIVEDVLRSIDAEEVTRFVGRRTVYTTSEIGRLARSVQGVLAIRFRQDRFLDPPVSLGELMSAEVVKSWPQSVTRVKPKGVQWIRQHLLELP